MGVSVAQKIFTIKNLFFSESENFSLSEKTGK
jgi:hypothetical protein